MPAEAIRINRRVLLQCSIGAPGLKQPFAQPQQNGALSAHLTFTNQECCTIRECPISGSRSAAFKPNLDVGFGTNWLIYLMSIPFNQATSRQSARDQSQRPYAQIKPDTSKGPIPGTK